MKRIVGFLMAVIIVVGTSVTVDAYSGVKPWFDKEIEEAKNVWNIIPSSFDELNFDENMTRAEFCQVLYRAYLQVYLDPPASVNENVFTDTNDYYVNVAYQLGLVGGYTDGTFKPDATITRQEVFKILYNFLKVYNGDYSFDSEQKDRILSLYTDTKEIGSWAIEAVVAARYEGIASGDELGRINPKGITSRAEGIIMIKRMLDSTRKAEAVKTDSDHSKFPELSTRLDNDFPELSTTKKEGQAADVDYNSNDPLNQLGYNSAKQKYVFASGSRYTSDTMAREHMVTITVDVWHIDTNGNKYPATESLMVNKAIAERVSIIFDEIFKGDEQFPIHTVHSYAWRNSSTSEHNQGLAIDINAVSNYMVRNGSIVAGTHWTPGEDPLSIPSDGDVVTIFNKYGFAWGGNYWRSANDYMHFSYFGR